MKLNAPFKSVLSRSSRSSRVSRPLSPTARPLSPTSLTSLSPAPSTLRAFLAALCVAASLAASAVPVSVAYQGVLRDAQGGVLANRQQTIEFRLYSEATGETTSALWGRSVAVLLDTNGLFNVSLADGNGSVLESTAHTNLVDALKAARTTNLFVGLTVVDSSGEIAPRQQILSVPYATFAQDVDSASGDFRVSGRAVVQNLEVSNKATFKGAVEFAQDVAIDKKLTVSGGLKVAAGGGIEGYGTIPVGGIIMWSGSTVPDGWALCNGQNGTPNLLNRFVLGSTAAECGITGGNARIRLTTNQMPKHRHEYFGDDQLEGRDDATTQVSRRPGGYDADSGKKGDAKVYWTGETGKGEEIDILPPYYQLAFIMRVK